MMGMRDRGEGVRWWPAVMVLLAGMGALVAVWQWPEVPRQQRIERTGMAGAGVFLLLMVWVVLFSRMRWRVRVGVVGLVVLGIVASAVVFEIKGVTGDLVPIVGFRWSKGEAVAGKVEAQGSGRSQEEVLEIPRANFPQFQGPNRNGMLPGAEFETNWVEHPPELLWRRPVGAAWTGFVVEGVHAITMEQRGEEEWTACYDVRTGNPIWGKWDSARYASTLAGEGPRTTPTIWSNLVFTLGGTGILNCRELSNGELVWTKNVLEDNEGKVPEWGLAGSPLVYEGMVIVSVGGSGDRALAAYDARSGEKRWAKGRGGADYSSPTVLKLMGEEQIIHFRGPGVFAHDDDGEVLWEHPWKGGHPHVSLPVAVGTNQVFISSGYGTGCELIELSRDAEGKMVVESVWKNIRMKSKFGTLLVDGGYVYGLDDGILACVELETGQRMWKDGRYGHGQGLLVGRMMLWMAESGEAVLVAPNPQELMEVARVNVFEEKTWNPPCVAGQYLILRNDREAACFQLGGAVESGKEGKKLL